MKDRKEKAQAILEAMDQVNEELLQRAYDTDTADKFHALRKTAPVRMPRERTITLAHRNAAIVASLAIALLIAFGGFGLALLLPNTLGPDPTTPPPMTQPTITIAPTETTEPTEPTEPTNPTEPTEPVEPILSGNCGEYATWTLDTATGTLTISGTGEMDVPMSTPWLIYHDRITTVIIEEGITSIANYAFRNFEVLTSVSLPEGLLYIGEYAFSVTGIQQLTIPSTVSHIANSAFMSCRNLRCVVVPAGVTKMGPQVFDYNEQLIGIFCEATEPQDSWSDSWSGAYVPLPVYYAHQWTYQDGVPVLNGIGIQGSCGENATWEFQKDTLIISGIGDIFDYTDSNSVPWDAYRINIKHIEVGEGILSIGDYAFSNLPYLASVQLPEGLIRIGDYAFQDCWIINAIEIPHSVTHIGERAFMECRKMKSVSLPNALEEIGTYAFANCSDITSIIIPSNLTELAEGVFSNCSDLRLVTLHTNITAIHKHAFYGCDIYELTLPDNLQYLGYGAFYNCSRLKAITIPASLTALGDFAFYGCYSLQAIYLPGDFPSFWLSLFGYAGSSDIFVYYPDNNVTWSEDVLTQLHEHFSYRMTFRATTFVNGKPILPENNYPHGPCGENANWEFNTDTGTLTIFGTGPMTVLTYSPWQGYRNQITQVIVADGITAIGGFNNLQQLTTVQIPDSVDSLYEYAFYGCHALQSIHLPDSIHTAGAYIFAYCYALEQVNIPARLTVISYGMFSDCRYLRSVDLHDGITAIDSYAFNNCGELETMTLPNSVTSMGGNVFSNCTNLQSITLSNQITMIADHAFRGCSSLQEIVLPDSVVSISLNAFNDCTNLTKIVIGSQMQDISTNAFYGCTQLKGFIISTDNPYITAASTGPIFNKDMTEILLMAPGYTDVYAVPDGVVTIKLESFYNCALSGVVLSNSVTKIEEYAFGSCKNMESVILSENLKVIGFRAFESCSALREVTIPASVEEVGSGAFSHCSAMQSATFLGAHPRFGTSVFLYVTGYLYYPPFDPEWTHASELIAVDMEWLPYICKGGHTIQILPGKDATCTEDGITEGKFCSVCEECILAQWDIPATGHTFTHWEYVPSADVADLHRRICTICGYTEETVADASLIPPDSGFCGYSATWHYANGILTISGTGLIDDFYPTSPAPWYQYSHVISQVIISDGIEWIGAYSFQGLIHLSHIDIPNGVVSIGMNAFEGCTSLKTVTLPESLTSISSMAFGNCPYLESVHFGANVCHLDMHAFYGCTSLKEVYFCGNMPWFMNEAFMGLTLTIYYPEYDSTWSAEMRAEVVGDITWIPIPITP